MEKVDLGLRLRWFRKEKKLTLKDLSRLSDYSINYISQVERGLNSPTVETLIKIANALDVSLVDLFSNNGPNSLPKVIRKSNRKSFAVDISGCNYEMIASTECKEFMDAFLIKLDPGASTANSPHKVEGKEFLFVIKGQLELNINGSSLELFQGDSICINSGEPHRLANSGRDLLEVISVSTPPRF
jgi:transcriptional regulator with XRE-family HTH domain